MGVLIAYLLGILTAVESKNNDGKSDHRHSYSRDTQPDPDKPVSVVCIPSLSDEERAENKKKKRHKAIAFWVQNLTLVVLSIYTGFTILIWHTMSKANHLTNEALSLNRRIFEVSQAAGLDCQITPNAGIGMTISLSCANRGETGASGVIGEMSFIRSDRHRVVQKQSRSISENHILKGGGIYRLFFVTNSYSWQSTLATGTGLRAYPKLGVGIWS